MTYRLAPSILSAEFASSGEAVHAVIAAGADAIHFDVTDHHFVPSLTIGPMACEAVRPQRKRVDGTGVPIDVQLMLKPVVGIAPDFTRAGADTFVAGLAPVGQANCLAVINAPRGEMAMVRA